MNPSDTASDEAKRRTGEVVRVGDEFGFIASEEPPGQDVYFKASWYRGSPPLRKGDKVTFELKTYGDRVQAHRLARVGEEPPSAGGDTVDRGAPTSDYLLKWAYLGYFPNVLDELKGKALRERWEFRNTEPAADRPAPILHSYLLYTFGRLVLEEKVLVAASGNAAAFNTGLVDPRYEPIFALFAPNDDPRAPWRLSSFCTSGEGADGQNLVRHFNPLPATAHYFDEPADLLYNTRVGKPEMDWRHVVIDRIDRYPTEFLEDHWPPGIEVQNTQQMDSDEKKTYWEAVGAAIEAHPRTYRSVMNRVKDAVDLAVKRTAWNFKTAVPQYYPRVRRLQLLLPICLVSDETPDMALAVEKTTAGSYLGHTILPLDWAYRNARLVCRPDSDWLAADKIDEGVIGEEE